MTSRSFKYFLNKKTKPLIFSRSADKQRNLKGLWEEILSQSIDFKTNELLKYDSDGIKTRIFFDEHY